MHQIEKVRIFFSDIIRPIIPIHFILIYHIPLDCCQLEGDTWTGGKTCTTNDHFFAISMIFLFFLLLFKWHISYSTDFRRIDNKTVVLVRNSQILHWKCKAHTKNRSAFAFSPFFPTTTTNNFHDILYRVAPWCGN